MRGKIGADVGVWTDAAQVPTALEKGMEPHRSNPSGDGTPLWRLMQKIEYCRHRAELAEAKAAGGSTAFRREMAEVAEQWRDLAHEIELLDQSSPAPLLRKSPPTD